VIFVRITSLIVLVMTSPKMWDPAFLSAVPDGDNKVNIALIVLNQHFEEDLFLSLWSSGTWLPQGHVIIMWRRFLASWRACADGGANRLYDLFSDEERRSACVNTQGIHPLSGL
jgi:hypothetical protein